MLLDGLRGLAALYVMLGHAVGLLTRDGTSLSLDAGAGGMLSLALRHGHLAVLVFFLISGFCIHYRQALLLAASIGDRTSIGSVFNVRAFARRRVRRLLPPLVAALVLTASLDYLGSLISPDFYAGKLAFWTSPFFGTASHSVSTLVGNALFQGGFVVQPFGTNGPLWSLAFEFWFYLLYPLLLVLSTRWGPWSVLVVPSVISVIACAVLPSEQPAPGGGLGLTPGGLWVAETLLYWIVWTLGAAIAEAYVGRFRIAAPLYWGFIALLVVVRWFTPPASAAWVGGWMLNDLLWSATFAVVLSVALILRPVNLPGKMLNVAARLGGISYSLYLVHIPVIAFVSACWFAAGLSVPVGVELALPTAAVAFCVAVLIWYLVERPFQRRRPSTSTIEVPVASAVGVLSTKGSSSA